MREYLRDGRATLAAAGRSAKSRMPPPHCCAAMRSCCSRAPATLAYVTFPPRRAAPRRARFPKARRLPSGTLWPFLPQCAARPSSHPSVPFHSLSPRLASPRLASPSPRPRLASPRALMQEPAQAVRGRTERSLQRTRTRRECASCRLTSGLSSTCVARAGAERRAACDAAAAAAARQLSARARGRRGVRHAMRHAARYRRA